MTREGLRASDVVQKRELIGRLSDKEIVAIAQHFSQLPVRSGATQAVTNQFERGRLLAGKLHCGSCHLPDYHGREQMPRLAGQREEYLAATMRAYRDKPRAGGDTIMTAAVYGLPDSDINALAHYLARLR
ncbi:MAG: c-type cytochrome [Burkholderiales bacterium]